jgi:Glycosyl transferase family 90
MMMESIEPSSSSSSSCHELIMPVQTPLSQSPIKSNGGCSISSPLTARMVSRMKQQQQKNVFRVYSVKFRSTIGIGSFLLVIIMLSIPSILSTVQTMSFLSSSSPFTTVTSRNTMEKTMASSDEKVTMYHSHYDSDVTSAASFQSSLTLSYDAQFSLGEDEQMYKENETREQRIVPKTKSISRAKQTKRIVKKFKKQWYSTKSFDFLPKEIQDNDVEVLVQTVKTIRRHKDRKNMNKKRVKKNREQVKTSVKSASSDTNLPKSVLSSHYDAFLSSLVRKERRIKNEDSRFVIRHPITNEPVPFYTYPSKLATERSTRTASNVNDDDDDDNAPYSIDYIGALQNRSIRFPSIDFRVRLYMSNWYIPACNKNDKAAIWYTTKRPRNNMDDENTNSSNDYNSVSNHSQNVGNNLNVVTVQNQEDGNHTSWDIKSIVDADVLFYVDRSNLFQLINDTQNQYGGYEISKINLLRSYSLDVVSSIIPSMDRIDWDNNEKQTVQDMLQEGTVSTRTQRRRLSIERNDDDDEGLEESRDEKEKKEDEEEGNTENDVAKHILRQEQSEPPPIVVQYGDWNHCRDHSDRWNVNIPSIKKFRRAIVNPIEYITETIIKDVTNANTNNLCTTKKRLLPPIVSLDDSNIHSSLPMDMMQYQSIVWKLNTNRHYGMLSSLAQIDTIPYLKKKDVAIFRGTMNSGQYQWKVNTTISDEVNCRRIQRCNIVLLHNNSTTIDAKITKPHKVYHPEYIDIASTRSTSTIIKNNSSTTRVYLRGEKISIQEMVQHKIIIMLEGNDVSSGLKWALLSSSVVVMPYPVLVTSWAMEELLEPYIHFVPIQHDLSDLHDTVQWILNNPIQAQYIALRGSLWIYDLFFHTNSIDDEQYVQDRILQRYRSNFFLN